MMTRIPLFFAAMAAMALPALASPQSPPAQSPASQSPAEARPADGAISMEDARRIATDNGVARVEEIKFDDGQWKVEGRDSLGSEIEIKLRGSDGTVLKLERERPASAKAGN